jgi:F-type H+-transporting ATPase subunit epsilon
MHPSFNKASSIGARALRASLKEDKRVAAEKRGATIMRYQKWENGMGGEMVHSAFAVLAGSDPFVVFRCTLSRLRLRRRVSRLARRYEGDEGAVLHGWFASPVIEVAFPIILGFPTSSFHLSSLSLVVRGDCSQTSWTLWIVPF